ncbi:MAG: GGDEF domain-containing protein [Methylococcales bacterium]
MVPISQTIYHLISAKLEWLDLLGRFSIEKKFILDQSEGFLENFLVDAQQFWLNNTKGTLRSGIWLQTDTQGITHPFEATASIIMGNPVLLVQHITERYLEMTRILQSARENEISRKKIEQLAYTDSLTGLYNRRGFLLHAEKYLQVARTEQEVVTIACIDLDGLKSINDQYGHHAGDQTIVNAANIFKKVFRQNDLLCRIGGDEFLVFMVNTNAGKTISLTTRLNRAIRNWNGQNIPRLQLSLSIGLAKDNDEQQPLEQLIKQADVNMYKNKHRNYKNDIAS